VPATTQRATGPDLLLRHGFTPLTRGVGGGPGAIDASGTTGDSGTKDCSGGPVVVIAANSSAAAGDMVGRTGPDGRSDGWEGTGPPGNRVGVRAGADRLLRLGGCRRAPAHTLAIPEHWHRVRHLARADSLGEEPAIDTDRATERAGDAGSPGAPPVTTATAGDGTGTSRDGWRLIGSTLRSQWRGVLVGVLVGLAWTVAKVSVPALVSKAIDLGITPGDEAALVRWSLAIGVAALFAAFTGLRRYWAFREPQGGDAPAGPDLRTSTTALRLPDRVQTGDLMSRSNTDLQQIQAFVVLIR
jgi:hypothetical protein